MKLLASITVPQSLIDRHGGEAEFCRLLEARMEYTFWEKFEAWMARTLDEKEEAWMQENAVSRDGA